jgi:hypothetical protein
VCQGLMFKTDCEPGHTSGTHGGKDIFYGGWGTGTPSVVSHWRSPVWQCQVSARGGTGAEFDGDVDKIAI